MSDPEEFRVADLARKRAGAPAAPEARSSHPAPGPGPGPAEAGPPAGGAPGGGIGALVPFDPLRILLALRRRWWWLAAGALLLAVPAAFLGNLRFETSYSATVQIMRRELPNSFRASDLGEAFKPRQFSVATIVSMMRTPSLLAKVGSQARPRLSASRLLGALTITPEKNTDLISISLSGRTSPAATVELLNAYAQEVVELTRTLQQQEAAELERFLADQLGRTETELGTVSEEMLAFSRDASFFSAEKEVEAYLRDLGEAESALQTARLEAETLSFRIRSLERELARQNPVLIRLGQARDQLKSLLVQYTEANPLVLEQQSRITALEAELAAGTNAPAEFQPGDNTVANAMFLDLVTLKAQREAIAGQLQAYESRRTSVEAQLKGIPEKAMRYARLRGRQQSLETTRDLLAGRQREARLFTQNAPGYYRLFALASPGDAVTAGRSRKILIVTAAAACAGVMLALLALAALEALDDRVVSPADLRRATGVRTLACLPDLASVSEADLATWRYRSWSLLARAVPAESQRALAFGIVSASAGEGRSTFIHLLGRAASERGLRTLRVAVTAPPGEAAGDTTVPLEEALDQPHRVRERLEASAGAGVTLAPPADWTWTSERRSRWSRALAQWRTWPDLAILLELPPASQLESALLAETLPAVFWLAASGTNRQSDIAAPVATFRLGQSRIAGAFLNRMPAVFSRLPDLSRFGFLLAGLALAVTLARGATRAGAEEAPSPGPGAQAFFSGTAAGPHLAPWQERLELGPGDLVNLSVYGRKDLARADVPVGPDGRISYLQAQGIVARGLTLDELRERLTAELRAYYRNAQVLVTPSAWRSKKYYLLGTIIDRGAYPLDRPLTVIEAIARARGIATGLLEQNTVEIADLPRAFLVRRGERVPVDFVRLFQQGDLSQNVLLEPDDYIYFPSSVVNEVYVLGSIDSPGTVGVGDRSTLLGVITTRGGFGPKAYRQRVLVVRGSLDQPETFVVNVAEILRGKRPDFPLQPKDIVYIADRPWARLEELTDMAIKAFITTAITTWTGGNIGPLITEPIIPNL